MLRNNVKDDLMDKLAQNSGTLKVRLRDYLIKMIFYYFISWLLTPTDKGKMLNIKIIGICHGNIY